MERIVGTGNRLIEVNLSNQRVKNLSIAEEDRRAYIGGKGLGLRLLSKRLRPGINPLGEENWLIFMTGVLMGTGAPCSGRFSGLTKSPLTNIIMHGTCGGPFGLALKTAGYDGLLITGKAPAPVALIINASGVSFQSAEHLWGLDTRQTQVELITDRASGALVIGPAGEARVRYANIISGYRVLNRGGMGAVMGAKNLKAVVAHGGTCAIIPEDKQSFNEAVKSASACIGRNSTTSIVYPKFGTASHVGWSNKNHILPVKNFTAAHHSKASNISGEALSFTFKSHHQTCMSCGIKCGHATFTEAGTRRIVPDYDALAMLGPNLGIFDARRILTWNEICELLGMDAISTGAALAWSMEAGEKNLFDSPVAFESPEGISQTIEDIAYRKGLGDELANGTRYLAEQYGGDEFAMHVKGLEIGAYDPRGVWGQGLGYAVANQGGCHRSSALFALEAGLGLISPCSVQSKAEWVFFFENLYAAIHSLHFCQLTAFAYLMESSGISRIPKKMLKPAMKYFPLLSGHCVDIGIYIRFLNAVTGFNYSRKEFLTAGKRIHLLERWLNTKEGIGRKDDTLPPRFLNESRKDDPYSLTVPLEEMLGGYYALRKYDDRGVPTDEALASLGIIDECGPGLSEQKTAQTRKIKKNAVIQSEAAVYDDAEIKITEEHNAHDLAPSCKDDAERNTEAPPQGIDKKNQTGIQCRVVTPNQNVLRKFPIKLVLWCLGRSIQASYGVDKEIQKEIDGLPHGYIFAIEVIFTGYKAVIAKNSAGKPRFLGFHPQGVEADLIIQMKGVSISKDFFFLTKRNHQFFAEQRLVIRGDTAAACRVARIVSMTAIYLLPAKLARRMVRSYPSLSSKRRYWGRFLIMLNALIGI